MNLISKTFALLSLSAAASFATAAPIDLGAAGDYTLLAMGDTPGGNLIIGSEAQIYGNVGARGELRMADGVTIHGNAVGGNIIYDGSASVTGTATVGDDAYWQGLSNDLMAASVYAHSLTADYSLGNINGSQSLIGNGGQNVIDIAGNVSLGGGQNLTLSGTADDVFIINVDGYLNIGSGAGILLDGVSAENVIFNVSFWAAMFGGADFSGTYIAPTTHWTIGDGATMQGTQVLAYNLSGNVQDVVGIPPSVSVPEPSSIVLMMMSLLGVALMRKKA